MCHPKGRSATVRHARRRSGERHERSIPRPPALPAPLADPPIAPQPTHTRLRRARSPRTRSGTSPGPRLRAIRERRHERPVAHSAPGRGHFVVQLPRLPDVRRIRAWRRRPHWRGERGDVGRFLSPWRRHRRTAVRVKDLDSDANRPNDHGHARVRHSRLQSPCRCAPLLTARRAGRRGTIRCPAYPLCVPTHDAPVNSARVTFVKINPLRGAVSSTTLIHVIPPSEDSDMSYSYLSLNMFMCSIDFANGPRSG